MRNARPRVLIIEDEEPLRNGLTDVFLFNGYDVKSAEDGRSGLEMALAGGFHLVLLDIMLPGLDGFSVCNQIREEDRRLPIIMLTAKTSEDDLVKGLKLGADDYVAKPFSVRQLLARADAVLRRSGKFHRDMASFTVQDLVVYPDRLCGHRDQQEMAFTRRELDLLCYLYAHENRPVSRPELLRQVWGYQNVDFIETRTVDIHVTKLRRKIERDPSTPSILVTVRGEGYQLKTRE